MGYKLLILLALLIGVLYSLHLLVKDYQAITGGRLLRLLFKRDTGSNRQTKPNVRWRTILQHDTVQCARLLFCELGARPPDTEVKRGFVYMLTLEPRAEDSSSRREFQHAYAQGMSNGDSSCHRHYPMCPFTPALLFDLVQYLIRTDT